MTLSSFFHSNSYLDETPNLACTTKQKVCSFATTPCAWLDRHENRDFPLENTPLPHSVWMPCMNRFPLQNPDLTLKFCLALGIDQTCFELFQLGNVLIAFQGINNRIKINDPLHLFFFCKFCHRPKGGGKIYNVSFNNLPHSCKCSTSNLATSLFCRLFLTLFWMCNAWFTNASIGSLCSTGGTGTGSSSLAL